MKRILSLFKGFRPKISNLRVTESSQSHRLMYAMAGAQLVHGDRVLADVGPVQLAVDQDGKGARIYFCNVRGVKVHKKLEVGDGDKLPMKVTIKGLRVSPPPKGIHYFNLKNVELFSNGTIQLIATKDTVAEECNPY